MPHASLQRRQKYECTQEKSILLIYSANILQLSMQYAGSPLFGNDNGTIDDNSLANFRPGTLAHIFERARASQWNTLVEHIEAAI